MQSSCKWAIKTNEAKSCGSCGLIVAAKFAHMDVGQQLRWSHCIAILIKEKKWLNLWPTEIRSKINGTIYTFFFLFTEEGGATGIYLFKATAFKHY